MNPIDKALFHILQRCGLIAILRGVQPHEVASLSRAQDQTPTTPPTLVLCGEPDLCRRYAIALQTYGFATPTIATQATATGLWQIALAAGLVVAPAPAPSHPFTAGSLAA